MKGTPRESVPGHSGRELKSKVIVPPMERVAPPVATEHEKQTRRLYIRVRDVYDYGVTEGCPGCVAAIKGEASKNHTEECRVRMTEIIEQQDELRVRRAHERANKEKSCSRGRRGACSGARRGESREF